MAATNYSFDWNDLAFGDKKPLRELRATFIMAPREVSVERFTQLIKDYLPKSNIVLGIAKEKYIDGFDDQPHFRTLQLKDLRPIIDKVNTSKTPRKIYTLEYFQRDVDHVVDKLRFKHVVLVNGSWRYAFHNRSTYYTMVNKGITYDMVSPFTDETEAKAYEADMVPEIAKTLQLPDLSGKNAATFNSLQMLAIAKEVSKQSYDYNFQIGVVIGRKAKAGDAYSVLTTAFNRVVPYQTYAMHHGASRERHFSPPHDLNHYDTIHAEVAAIVQAQHNLLSLAGSTLFINLLPCPSCARTLTQTDIEEIVYQADHSEGYAIKMLELAGKTVRRVV